LPEPGACQKAPPAVTGEGVFRGARSGARRNHLAMKRVALLVATCVCALAAGAAHAAKPTPIPQVNVPPAKPFKGKAAKAHAISGVSNPPQNPFMARNGLSEIHDDGWQSDIYSWGGPLGHKPHSFSSYLAPGRDCGTLTFDRKGRVVSICIGLSGPTLYMFSAKALATLASFSLPPRTPEDILLNPNIFQDFSAGGYFYLDRHDRVVTSTTTQHIYVIAETSGPGFKLAHDYDLTTVLHPDEEIVSQLPDSHGLEWFVARRDGVVGTLNLKSGKVHVVRLGSGTTNEVTKSIATDAHGGVYVDTNQKLYRFVAGRGGAPKITWQVRYPNNGAAKPGQLDAGTGTTPVVLGGGRYVAINDNADPMDVMVYGTSRGNKVCRVPVFKKGRGADENAFIGAGKSIVVENNYGYQRPTDTSNGGLTTPGVARVDMGAKGCRVVWTNHTARVPSVVSKLSLKTGLVYTYTKDPGQQDPWYWTAIDFRTGRIVYEALAGTGVGYNNNYAGIAINPSGTEYVGALGGIVALRDGR